MERRPPDDAQLEARLRELGALLAYPAPRDLAAAVRSRIEERRASAARSWTARLSFVPALSTAALLIVVALAFQPVAATAAEALGLRGIGIFRGPAPTATARVTPPASVAPLLLFRDSHRVASVSDAQREAGFALLVASTLGTPDEVWVRLVGPVDIVYLVYGPRPGIAVSPSTGLGVLVMQARGYYDKRFLGKFLGPTSRAEELTVNGGRGVWIEGGVHDFFFVAPNGDIIADTIRVAGNVLVWEQAGSIMRIEAQVTREEALRIAASMR